MPRHSYRQRLNWRGQSQTKPYYVDQLPSFADEEGMAKCGHSSREDHHGEIVQDIWLMMSISLNLIE